MVFDEENGGSSENLQGIFTSEQLLVDEIVATRTAWFFHGICAKGTRFPDNTVSKDSGADVTAGGSHENQTRYGDTALRYSPTVPLLYYASNILNATKPDSGNRRLIVLSRVPSEVPEIDEIVINGFSGTLDTRSTEMKYSLIQRINSASSQKLFDNIIKDPRFFEHFFQTAFPSLDSIRDSFNGLYRFLTTELILLEPLQLEAFAKTYPAKLNWRNNGTFDNPVFYEQEAFALLNQGRKIILDPPVGVGTVQDFIPIKTGARIEWK